MMDSGLVEQCRVRLLQEKQYLDGILRGNSNPFSTEPDWEKEDRYSVMEAGVINHTATEERLRDIKAALQKILEGSFGICIKCRELIPLDRLLAHPEVKRCTSCQKIWERNRPRRYW